MSQEEWAVSRTCLCQTNRNQQINVPAAWEPAGTCPKASCKLAANDSSKQRGLRVTDRTAPDNPYQQNAPSQCRAWLYPSKKKEGKAGCSVCLSWVDTPRWTQGFARILLFFNHLITSVPLQSASTNKAQTNGSRGKCLFFLFFWAAAIKKISQQNLWFLSSGNYDKLRWGMDSTAWDPSGQCHRSQPIFQLPLLWVDGRIDSLISFIFLICYSAIKQFWIA